MQKYLLGIFMSAFVVGFNVCVWCFLSFFFSKFECLTPFTMVFWFECLVHDFVFCVMRSWFSENVLKNF